MRSFRILLAAVALFAVAQQAVNAQTWNGNFAGNDNWDEAGNWSGGVPGAASNVNINVFPNATSFVNTDFTVASVDIGFSDSVSINGGQTLTTTGNLVLLGSGATIAGGGDLIVGGNLSMTNNSALNGGGSTTVNGSTNLMGSAKTISRDLTTAGGTWTGDGTVSLTGSTFTNTAGNTFTRTHVGSADLIINAGSSVQNLGVFELAGAGNFDIVSAAGGAQFVNSGEIRVSSGTLTFGAGAFSDNGGTINVASGAAIETGGTITVDSGVYTGNGSVNDNAIASGTTNIAAGTGDSGTLTINGNLGLQDTSTLTLNLGALSSGDFTGNLLDVNGTATIAATSDLVVSLGAFDATVADVGKTFQFLTADNAVVGEFLTGAGGANFTLGIYTFEVDYNVGSNGAALRLVSAVPEPSGLALLGVCAVGTVLRRRRRS